jgi:mannose/fructose/N-acetylgalactosamine-specific phosphotransferase system component IIB
MTEFLKTSDYDLFISFKSNREIDYKHVAKLVKKIQKRNLLHINPILVDSKMRIIDGQHRVEAARILQVQIYHIVSDDVARDDISMLNSNQKNWSGMDYINFYTVEGKPEFLKFSKFLYAYPDIKISAALTIISGKFTRNTAATKEGILDIENINFGHQVGQALAVLNKKYQHAFIYDSRFPVALVKAMQHKNFSLDTFIKRIDNNPRAFVKCTTTKEAGKMIEEIYNYRTSVKQIEV